VGTNWWASAARVGRDGGGWARDEGSRHEWAGLGAALGWGIGGDVGLSLQSPALLACGPLSISAMVLSVLAQICSTMRKRDKMVVKFSQLSSILLGLLLGLAVL